MKREPLDPHRRLRRPGSRPVMLPGPDGSEVWCTLTIKPSFRGAAYTLTLFADGTVIDTLRCVYLTEHHTSAWCGTAGGDLFYGVRREPAWASWVLRLQERASSGALITEWWRRTYVSP